MRVYISADYDSKDGDREVVERLKKWGADDKHKTDFVDMAEVISGSVSKESDCRICDLKAEFNAQINASSAVIIVIGSKTASRTAGSECSRCGKFQYECFCTPYKQNSGGSKICKRVDIPRHEVYGDFCYINNYSYLRHEFEQANIKHKKIIVLYNSLYKQPSWLPFYLKDYEYTANPFWIKNERGDSVGDYYHIKKMLGYE